MTEHNLPTHGRFVNLSGKAFGRLTVVEFGGMVVLKHCRRASWVCKCECGKEARILQRNLVTGHTLSCGCLMVERTKSKNTRHGATVGNVKTPEFKIWCGIRKRCYDKNCKKFENYGGRGIAMSDEWRNNFEAFLKDMGPRPSTKHSIDRFPDVNGNYEKANCRWATGREQCRNKRNNRLLTFNGETKCLREWAEKYGISDAVVSKRLERGWSISKSLTEPIRYQYRNSNYRYVKPADK